MQNQKFQNGFPIQSRDVEVVLEACLEMWEYGIRVSVSHKLAQMLDRNCLRCCIRVLRFICGTDDRWYDVERVWQVLCDDDWLIDPVDELWGRCRGNSCSGLR